MSTGRLSVFSTMLFLSNLFHSEPDSSLLFSCRALQCSTTATKTEATSFNLIILHRETTQLDCGDQISGGQSVTMFSRGSAYYKTPAVYLAQN